MANITGLTTRASVQAWLDLASTVDGNIGELASGTFSGDWGTGALSIRKGVTIRGQGPNSTRLQGASIKFIGGTATVPNWASNSHPRISNFTMQFASGTAQPTGGVINFSFHVTEFEIDHIDFAVNPGSTVLNWHLFSTADSFWGWGVVHHCHFHKLFGGDSIQTDQPSWVPLDGTNNANALADTTGGGSWADYNYWAGKVAANGTYLGSALSAGASLPIMPCVRFEDNIFEQDPFSLTTLSGGGARREIRFNTFFNSQVAGHGAETNHPGGRSTEYYNNRFVSETFQTNAGAYNSRSSSSVCFNNRCSNVNKVDRITGYRRNFYGQALGSADGANPWDKNKKGNFTDTFGLSYTTNAGGGAAVDSAPGHGDIYWSATYTGTYQTTYNPNSTSHVQPMTVSGLPNLTLNGTGNAGTPSRRWKGFVLRNKSLYERNTPNPPNPIMSQTGSQILSSDATSVSVGSGGPDQHMEVASGDVLEIRLIDQFIHQSGNGKGEFLEFFNNRVTDAASTYPGGRPANNITWNLTQNLRIYPNDLVEGMWFWDNKCSHGLPGSETFTSADVLYYDDALTAPAAFIGNPENPQQFKLDRNIFVPGLGLLAGVSPTQTAGRPVNYPYDPSIDETDTLKRLRVGCDDECYNTFAHYPEYAVGGTGRVTIQPSAPNKASGLCAAHYYGRTYPDYLVATVPAITSGSATTFTTGVASQEFIFTTSNFTGTPTLGLTWTGSTPANVTFTNGVGAGGVASPGKARLSGSATGATLQDYPATITATTGAQSATPQSFTLTVTSTVAAAPDITFDQPPTGSQFVAPTGILLSATPTPHGTNTITKVEFYRGGSTLITDSLGNTASITTPPYRFLWTGATAATYSLTAKAFDSAGQVTTSSPAVSITVNPAPTGLIPPNIVVTA